MGTLLIMKAFSNHWMNYPENEVGKQVDAENVKFYCGKPTRLPGVTAVTLLNPIQRN